MLKKRMITVLTFNDGVLFRTKDFCPDYRYTLSFVDAWSIDEIVILDVTRPGCGQKSNFYRIVSEFAERCFVPLAAGGGVRSIDDFKTLLGLGADKVIVNTAAVERPEFISQAARLFGAQCVVLSIDAKKNERGSYEVFTDFASKPSGLTPQDWARTAQALGTGEVFLTSITRDGSLEGYDNELNKTVAAAVDIPVLICGGAGKWQDFVDGFNEGMAQAVCTTNIYHFTEASIKSAKNYLKNSGIDVRTG